MDNNQSHFHTISIKKRFDSFETKKQFSSSSPRYSHLRALFLRSLKQNQFQNLTKQKKRYNVTEKNTNTRRRSNNKKIASFLLILFLPLLFFFIHTFKTSSEPESKPQSEPQREPMATMDSLISLVNRIQRACTLLGDHGADHASHSLWESLPSVAVVGGQVRFGSLFEFDSPNLLLVLRRFHIFVFAYHFYKNAEFWKIIGAREYRRT
jgi:hypothetical protein